MIHEFLSERSYWAKARSLETVIKSIENSICFGAYNDKGEQVGFARVATDYAIFGRLMDLFVLENYRGVDIGKPLIKTIVNHPHLKELKRMGLETDDAHGLYQQFGFTGVKNPEKIMELIRN